MFHKTKGEELNQQLTEFNADVVGISTMTPNFPDGKEIAQSIKDTNEDVLVVLGGWHASGCVQAFERGQETETLSEILSEKSPFDLIVSGEGDIVLPELMRRLQNGEPIEELEGIGYLAADGIRLNTAQKIKNLNILEDPSWEGLEMIYKDGRTDELDLSVHFNRGCRYACSFCSTETVCGKGVRRFIPERSVDYIQNILEKFNPPVITFTDEDFFSSIEWVEKVVDLIIERKLHKKFGPAFDTFASINDLIKLKRKGRKDLLRKMKEAGFGGFTVGIESFNPRVLKDYNKERMILELMTIEERRKYKESPEEEKDEILVQKHLTFVQEAINFAQENGIIIVGDYILGNLGETEEEVRQNFEKFCNLKGLVVAYIPTFTPFPGTKLWEKTYKSGTLIRTEDGNIDWTRFDSSKGAMRFDYDIDSVRDELEVQFYTSERYHQDMLAILQKQPLAIKMFKGRFEYLKNEFGGNELVENRLDELRQLEKRLK